MRTLHNSLLAALAAACLLSALATSSVQFITLAWNPCPGASNYVLYMGETSGRYAARVVLGNQTQQSVLINHSNTCFVITAVYSIGESGPSNEVCYP